MDHRYDEVRQSMLVLPSWMQPFLTQLTAKPYLGQASWDRPAIDYLFSGFVWAISGIVFGYWSVVQSGLWLLALPLTWFATVHGTRNCG